MRKIKSFVLAVIGLLCSISVSAEDFEVDGIYYNITSSTNKTVEVTYRGYDSSSYSNEYSGAVTIPESVTYNGNTYSVTSIGSNAFCRCYRLISVEIPNSVISIGSNAFYGCSGMTSVEIGNSVTSIGSNAFYGCSGMTSVEIGNSVTSIGSNAFYGCSGLTSVVIPNSVTSIDEYTFCGCSGLTSVEIPNSVTSIGFAAFNGCSGLTSVEIGNSVTSIGNYAFEDCSSLTSVEIGNSVTSIGNYAFSDCSGLTSVEIPNSVTSIGYSAFQGCYNLYFVLNNSDFNFTAGSSSYGSIAYYAKVVCNKYDKIDDFIFTEGDDAYYLRTYVGEETELELPANYNGEKYAIGAYAFYKRTDLKSVSIPNSVTSIGDYAFEDCSSLTSVEIPNSVTSIGNNAFNNCYGLTSVEIPNSVTSIGEGAFSNCSGLTSVEIGNSVTNIGNRAFYDCKKLKTVLNRSNISFRKGSSGYGYVAYYANLLVNKYDGQMGDFLFAKDNDIYYLQIYIGEATELVLPDKYKESNYDIGFSAFEGCSGLTSVVIPNSVTSIGNYAFEGCSGLTSVVIPNSVTSIGFSAFEGCSGLTSVEIPNGVTSIESGTFEGCSGLTSVVIPNSVTRIGSSAFKGCSGLTSVEIPNYVTYIDGNAFYGCNNLKTVLNRSNLTFSKGSSDNGYVAYYANLLVNKYDGRVGDFLFAKDNNIYYLQAYIGESAELVLPDNYKESNYAIGDKVFWACSSLTSVVIPNSVTSIGYSAFYGCNNLKKVLNRSNLTFSKGSSDNGYVAYYAVWVVNNYDGQIGDILFSRDNNIYYLQAYIGEATELVLPDKYKESNYDIGFSAFEGCSGLTSVVIPNSVTSIGNYAFCRCSGLTSVAIPNSVTSIGDYAFNGCSGLKSLTVGSGVLSIGENKCTPTKTIWLTNTPPSGWGNLQGSINYVANDQYGNSNNVKVYPYLSSVFETDGVKYVPVSPSERTCDAIDCNYDGSVENINIGETVSYRGVAMTVKQIMPYTAYQQLSVKNVNVSHKGDVGDYAFYGCSSIANATIANEGNIGDYAFYGCSSIANATIANEGNIGDCAFEGAMTTANAELKVTNKGSIGTKAFYGCSAITNVIVANEGNIGDCAFEGAMTTANAELKVTNKGSIGTKAFYGCSAITNATISNEGYVGDSAFEGAMTATNAELLVTNKGHIGTKAFYGCTAITNATISNEGYVGDCAFEGAMTATNAELLVTNKGHIGTKAFYGCTAIANATISNEGYVGDCAFEGAMTVANADLKVTNKGNIGPRAFYGCRGIKTAIVDINNTNSSGASFSLTFDGWTSPYTSNNSTSSKTYTFTQEAGTLSFDWWVSSESGRDYLKVVLDGTTVLSKSGSDSGTFSRFVGSGNHTLVLKYSKDSRGTSGQDKARVSNIRFGGVAYDDISVEVFRECTSLTSLTLGDSITSIGFSAFRECSSLTEVKIPNKVKSLKDYCFAGITALKQVELGDSLQIVGTYCFSSSGLESISIPASVTRIGSYAFDDCTKMTDVVIEDRTADLSLGSNGSSPLFADCPLDSVYIGGNITYNTSSSYGYSPFYRNTSLRSVVITDKEEEISENEFYGCTNLKNVTIGSNVNKIGNWAFSGCSNLDYFSFGKSVETIGQEAFSDCVNLTKLISHAEVPPTCGTMALDDINKWNCVLQVPQSCLAAYQQADQWKEFFFIEDVLTAIGGVIVDGAVPATADVYSTNGMLVKRNADLKNLKHELPAGVYIIGGKKVWVK